MRNSSRKLEELRQRWGKEIARERAMAAIALYHQFTAKSHRTVDEQTWQDLGMDDVFAKLDRTVTMPGRQMLYARLRCYGADSAVLTERARQHAVFRSDAASREELQSLLVRLDLPRAEYLVPLLLSDSFPLPENAWLYFVLGAMPVIFLVGAFLLGLKLLILAAMLFVFINTFIYATYGQKILPHFSGFAYINTLLGLAGRLGEIRDRHALPELTALAAARPTIKKIRSRLGWLVVDRTALPDLMQAVFGYLNMFFLFDVLVFIRSQTVLREHQGQLIAIMEAVGALDASISVASYIEGQSCLCVPESVDTRQLKVDDLRHPLLGSPVGNAFNLSGRSALITGPNMAGKTCFVRTIGINLLLAQTLNLCLARSAKLPRVTVQSAIRREDALTDGESYFFAEIKRILEFMGAGDGTAFRVILIDEIFRGTNTIERIASSVAVLKYLARDHLVLVTTHDVELQRYLSDSFEMYHFSDQVIEGKYGFDYLIHSGVARSHNAIQLLKFSHYPESVTTEAELLAEQLTKAAALANERSLEPKG